MIIKSNLIKFIKNTYNVSSFSYKKKYSYGRGKNKYTFFSIEVNGEKKEIEIYGDVIYPKDIISKVEHCFNLEKRENATIDFSNKNLNYIANKFSKLPIDTEELIYDVAKLAYNYDFFDGNGYSDIKVIDNFVEIVGNAIKTKNIDNDVIDNLKNINIDSSEFVKLSKKEMIDLLKIIYNYFKLISSKEEYRLILVTSSRLHNVTQDNKYSGSNFVPFIGKAIKAVKKHNLTSEDDFRFYISISDSKSWEQGACIGYSSISHSEWTETLYLEHKYNDYEVYSRRNSSAYGYY